MEMIYLLAIAVASSIIMFVLGWVVNSRIGKNTIGNAKERALNIIEDAEKEARNIKREKLIEVKDEWFKKKQ